jgi:hypothetical protein
MTEVRNPYAAPDAVVADVAVPDAVPPENKHVKWACIVLWCSLAITLIALPVTVRQQPAVVSDTFGWGGTLATGIIGAVLAALIIWWVTEALPMPVFPSYDFIDVLAHEGEPVLSGRHAA